MSTNPASTASIDSATAIATTTLQSVKSQGASASLSLPTSSSNLVDHAMPSSHPIFKKLCFPESAIVPMNYTVREDCTMPSNYTFKTCWPENSTIPWNEHPRDDCTYPESYGRVGFCHNCQLPIWFLVLIFLAFVSSGFCCLYPRGKARRSKAIELQTLKQYGDYGRPVPRWL